MNYSYFKRIDNLIPKPESWICTKADLYSLYLRKDKICLADVFNLRYSYESNTKISFMIWPWSRLYYASGLWVQTVDGVFPIGYLIGVRTERFRFSKGIDICRFVFGDRTFEFYRKGAHLEIMDEKLNLCMVLNVARNFMKVSGEMTLSSGVKFSFIAPRCSEIFWHNFSITYSCKVNGDEKTFRIPSCNRNKFIEYRHFDQCFSKWGNPFGGCCDNAIFFNDEEKEIINDVIKIADPILLVGVSMWIPLFAKRFVEQR